MMNRKVMYAVLSGALLIGTTVVRAQHATPEEAPPPPEFMLQDGGPGPGGPDGPGEPFGGMELLGFGGMHGGKIVKGAPFSATAVSESTQTLADGNHITRSTKTNLFRDSQGRFRREATVPALGAAAGAGQTHSFVFINDPVAGTGYMLQPDKKEAFQMNKGKFKSNTEADGAARKEKFKEKFDARQQKEIADGTLKIDNLGTQTVRGMVFQRPANRGVEQAFRSAIWRPQLYADQHSTHGTSRDTLYGSFRLHRETRTWRTARTASWSTRTWHGRPGGASTTAECSSTFG